VSPCAHFLLLGKICKASRIAERLDPYSELHPLRPQHTTTERMVSKPPQITYAETVTSAIRCRTNPRKTYFQAFRPRAPAEQHRSSGKCPLVSGFGFGLTGTGSQPFLTRSCWTHGARLRYSSIRYLTSRGSEPLAYCAQQNGGKGVQERVARGTSRRELPVSSNPVEAPEQEGFHAAESAAFPKQPSRVTVTSTGVESAASQLQSRAVKRTLL